MVVIIDTNLARNENSFTRLLGNRSQLEAISAKARLVIPEVVIDEIIAQKRSAFQKEVASLKRSGVLRLTDFSESAFESLDFDGVERGIRDDESIGYDILPLPPADYVFPLLYGWAISHSAPFEEKSDKGFKDACIVASIEHYLEQHKGEGEVVLCTDDNRMASYFEGRGDIRVENDLGRAIKEKEAVAAVAPRNVDSAKETGEGSPTAASSAADKTIDALRNSRSFQTTHRLIEELAGSSQQISATQELAILSAALANDQVSWILRDDDVCDFIKPIFLKRKDELTDDDYRQFINSFDLPDEREEERGEPFFTAKEKQAFRAFVSAMEGHIVSRMFGAAVGCEPDALLNGLKKLLDMHRVDDALPSVKPLASILIDGSVETKPGSIPIRVVSDFATMLEKSSPRKREAISINLAAHLRDIDEEFPF